MRLPHTLPGTVHQGEINPARLKPMRFHSRIHELTRGNTSDSWTNCTDRSSAGLYRSIAARRSAFIRSTYRQQRPQFEASERLVDDRVSNDCML